MRPAVGAEIFGRRDPKRLLEALASAGAERGPEYQRALADVGLAVGVVLSIELPVKAWRVVSAEHVLEQRAS